MTWIFAAAVVLAGVAVLGWLGVRVLLAARELRAEIARTAAHIRANGVVEG
ncbi:hypothetical protein [Thermoactinospora rubra]|uniref:hypothetical protein n=1 Tax=Thermoactinospora rubra TaxID=1088767 RepID=UPI001301BEE5|nr:hypothetical protein [Thermoactinospora rubra]